MLERILRGYTPSSALSTLQKPFMRLLQRRLLRPVSQFLLRLLMKSTKPSHNSDPVVHQGSVVSLLNCQRLVVLVAPSGCQISTARLGTPVRPTTIGNRELFRHSIKGKDLGQTVEITQALHYFQCQARSIRVLLNRIKAHLHHLRRTEQSGFTPHRSAIDRTATLNMFLQTKRGHRKPYWVAYVDFRSAFDSADRQSLWLLLISKRRYSSF